MATRRHQAPSGRILTEVIGSFSDGSKTVSTKRFRNAQWERRIEEDWQGHLETLRQCIGELLIGNQHAQMELVKAGKRRQE